MPSGDSLLLFVLSLDGFNTKVARTEVYKCAAVNDILKPVFQLCQNANMITMLQCSLRGFLKKQSYVLAGKIWHLTRLSC